MTLEELSKQRSARQTTLEFLQLRLDTKQHTLRLLNKYEIPVSERITRLEAEEVNNAEWGFSLIIDGQRKYFQESAYIYSRKPESAILDKRRMYKRLDQIVTTHALGTTLSSLAKQAATVVENSPYDAFLQQLETGGEDLAKAVKESYEPIKNFLDQLGYKQPRSEQELASWSRKE